MFPVDRIFTVAKSKHEIQCVEKDLILGRCRRFSYLKLLGQFLPIILPLMAKDSLFLL